MVVIPGLKEGSRKKNVRVQVSILPSVVILIDRRLSLSDEGDRQPSITGEAKLVRAEFCMVGQRR